jgi:hypothetical protein
MLIHLTLSSSLAFVIATVVASNAQALCLDRRDLDRYHRPSLEQEIKTADAIVVGTVLHVKRLNEDKTDPEGWTSFIYTVRVKKTLRGNTPPDIALSASNDSGDIECRSVKRTCCSSRDEVLILPLIPAATRETCTKTRPSFIG